MKFGSVAGLFIVILLRGFAFGQDCPADNAFLWGRKISNITPGRMETLSGLAASRTTPGVLWAVSSGTIDEVFAISTSGSSIDDYTLNRNLTDVQAIAVGPSLSAGQYLYVADCGGLRSSTVIGRFLEPVVDTEPHGSGNIPFPGQNYHTVQYVDESHDARALMVDPETADLFLITYEPQRARVYVVSQITLRSPEPVWSLMATLPIGFVTAADISADGRQIIVRNHEAGLRWVRTPGLTIPQALQGEAHAIPILPFEFIGESIAFASDGSGYFTTGQGVDPALYFFERNRTRYTTGRQLSVLEDASIDEVSGVAASRRNPGVLWIHRDGRRSEAFAISTAGVVYGTFQFNQAMTDFEDIAMGPGPNANIDYVYGGDIGDNNSTRAEIRIFRFPEPILTQPAGGVFSANESIITMQYPDGAHDAEALVVDPRTGDVYVATKENTQFRLYRGTKAQIDSGAVVTLTLVHTGDFGPVSGGDISPDGSQIVLRHENEARVWRRSAGETIAGALSRAGEKIPVIGIPLEPNGEGITFTPDSKSYYTMSEGQFPGIYRFDLLPQPSFAVGAQREGTKVRFTVNGCDGSRLRIESSADFVIWQEAGSTYLADGVGTFEVLLGQGMLFYRAMLDGP